MDKCANYSSVLLFHQNENASLQNSIFDCCCAKRALRGLNAPAFELGKIQKDVGIVLFRLEGVGLNL